MHRQFNLQLLHWVFVSLFMPIFVPVSAIPTLKELHGNAQLIQEGKNIRLIAKENVQVLWENFILEANENIEIIASDPNICIENIVTGSFPAKIAGKISANANLFLQNPNGIIIGPEANIQSGSFIASTKDLITDLLHNGILHRGVICCPKGNVFLIGKVIKLEEDALVDVSGEEGGGAIYIGGGWKGENSAIPNADSLYISQEAKIVADARKTGNGGEVVLWAKNSNQFLGSIYARGVEKGGTIEVSAENGLVFVGQADFSATNGPSGSILIDPNNLIIQAGPYPPSPDIDGTPGNDVNAGNLATLSTPSGFGPIDSYITATALNPLLTGGTVTLAAVFAITVNQAVTPAGPGAVNLVFDAQTVNLNQPITFPNGGGTLSGSTNVLTVNVGSSGLVQNGLDVAASGATVNIAAGTYVGEFQVISKNLNVIGAGENSTILQAPGPLTRLTQSFIFGVTYWCVFMVDNQAAPIPQTVNISNLTLDGDSQQDSIISPIYGNSDRLFGIGYHNASGTIQNVHVTNMRQSSTFNQLTGGGIINASNVGTVSFTVTNCLIDFYQRLGIDCRGSALTANITHNIINRGFILTPNTSTATPNGMQFSGSAGGTIVNNIVENNIATVLGANAAGIIPFGAAANLIISGNTLNNNDIGIAAIQNGDNLNILNNVLNFTITPGVNPPIGIVVQEPLGSTTLIANIMNNIPSENMELNSSTNQPFSLSNNQFIGSQTGLVISGSGAEGPVVTMNHDSFVGTIGFYIQEVAAPNDVWPSTASVSFDGLVSGHMTFAQFQQVLTKIFDKHNDPALGLVLEFIPEPPPSNPLPPSFFVGEIEVNKFLNITEYVLKAKWGASPSSNVILYRIYKGNHIVEEEEASSCRIFVTPLHSKREARKFSITAVNSDNLESVHVPLIIIQGR